MSSIIIKTHGEKGLLQMRDGTFAKVTNANCHALLADKIKGIKQSPSLIKLCSCHSAEGGRFSNAQVMANQLKLPVMGFYGITHENIVKAATGNKKAHPIFHPQENKLNAKISELGNRFIGNLLKIRIFITHPTLPEPFKY
ncbi:TPA: hypothetical protein ACHWKL_002455 [Providencia stuartii]|uniref:Uncharacterized protein n=3 Tax=Providencia stuartii TaxID=588 RepID=A0AAJ1JFJ7_PROST|nr:MULTISPECIES: hypothetical protein [Providencia]AFH94342.1 hypothetical protein S70_12475 [Providencia stuartii MRSN 2154]EDU58268.1 hypothetical protein PROSTU_04003 [Providencia stuartii ATCC 25827]QPN40237.1 hypothetical protein I3B46_19550 [Providencia sp. 2.29]SST03656.1 Uncharacterised protein [Acinetobacter baumannii]AIN64243.1 hypothetical protein DR96_677 [Providencia stuartii]